MRVRIGQCPWRHSTTCLNQNFNDNGAFRVEAIFNSILKYLGCCAPNANGAEFELVFVVVFHQPIEQAHAKGGSSFRHSRRICLCQYDRSNVYMRPGRVTDIAL